jgi:hypothetical protein
MGLVSESAYAYTWYVNSKPQGWVLFMYHDIYGWPCIHFGIKHSFQSNKHCGIDSPQNTPHPLAFSCIIYKRIMNTTLFRGYGFISPARALRGHKENVLRGKKATNCRSPAITDVKKPETKLRSCSSTTDSRCKFLSSGGCRQLKESFI